MAAGGFYVLIFTQQFASMIRSNLHLVDVLDNLAAETPQRKLKASVDRIGADVRRGMDLSDAMARHPSTFDQVYVSVVKSGIESGRLAEALTQIAEYQGVMHEITRKVRAALTYPIFVLAAFIAVFNMQVFFILPRFETMFQNFDKKLPWPTQFLLDLGAAWKEQWPVVVGVLVLVILAFIIWINTTEGRAVWDRIKLRIPIVGPVWRMSSLARFLRTLAVQVQNEVGVLKALRLAADAASNTYVREILYDIAADIERGRGIAASFREHRIFHGIVLQMIAAGEEAGTLDELLMSSANYFDSLTQDRLDRITGLINPVLTVVVGLGIAGMMIASFLPVFQMGSAI
jgi:type IV pilus assembly protein PilC